MIGRRAGAAALLLVLAAGPAVEAQQAPGYRAGDVTVAAGGLFSGGYPVGDRSADLRRNTTGGGGTLPLFRAESTLERAGGLDVRVGVAVTRRFGIEVGGTYARPRLGVAITGDSEAGGPVDISTSVEQYTVDVSGVVQLPWRWFNRRARPYVLGGGGYLRQLLEDRFLVETGSTVHGGGGVAYWLRGAAGKGRAVGVRGEARVVRRVGGIDFDDRGRTFPTVSGLFFAAF